MKTSDKVILLLHRKNITKIELSKKLDISRPTLDNKISSNFWSIRDITILKSLGLN